MQEWAKTISIFIGAGGRGGPTEHKEPLAYVVVVGGGGVELHCGPSNGHFFIMASPNLRESAAKYFTAAYSSEPPDIASLTASLLGWNLRAGDLQQ